MRLKIFAVFMAALFMSSMAAAMPASKNTGTNADKMKKYITSNMDANSIELFQENGCEITKKQKRILSLICPEPSAKELGLTEDIQVFVLGSKNGKGNSPSQDTGPNAQVNADRVWNMGYTGTGIKIAVIDTGMDYTHPELADSYAGGWDFSNNDGDPMDDHGHGTHVSGIITANSGTAKGAAPDAEIFALKVLDAYGGGTFGDVAEAIYYAVDGPDGIYGTLDDPGVSAISMSIGSSPPYTYSGTCDGTLPELRDAIDYAVSRNVVVVSAAGNYGESGVSIPACMSGTLSVGAVDSNNVRPSWSAVGNSLDMMAPGVSIYSTVVGGEYGYKSGTSMAAPRISGVIALVKQANPGFTAERVTAALKTTAKDLGFVGFDAYYGWGLADAYKAVRSGQTSKGKAPRF